MPDPAHPALPANIGGYLPYNSGAQYMQFGDFNGDGKLDYAWIPYNQQFWLIAYGTDTGFTMPDPAHPALPANIGGYLPYNSGAQYMQFGDFNGDGKLDYAWIPYNQQFWLIAYGTDTGFTMPDPAHPASPAHIGGYLPYNSGAQYMQFGDLNGDGKLYYAWIPYNQQFWLIAYGTDTGFTMPDPAHPALPANIGGYLPYNSGAQYMQFGDFNGDGKLDYAWIPYNQQFWLIAYGTDTGFTMPDPAHPALPANIGGYLPYNSGAQYMQFGDFNGDGKLDYAWIPYNQQFWLIAYGTDTGFTMPDPAHPALPANIGGYLPYNSGAQYMQFGDFNGDGKLDYAWIPYNQQFWLIAYGTDTGFTMPDPAHPALPANIGGYLPYNSGAQYMHFGDFNGDGKLDYAWIPYNQQFWLIAYGTDTGFTVPDPTKPALPANIGGYLPYNSGAQYMQFGDFNGDGKLDYAWIPYNQQFWLIAYGTGTSTGFTMPDPTHPALPANIGGYLPYNSGAQYMQFGDFNGDGKLDYAWIPYNQQFWLIAYGTGTSTGFTMPDPTHPALPANIGGYLPYNSGAQYMQFGDFNGDGKLDYAWIPYNQQFWLIASSTGLIPDLLVNVTTGLGAVTNITNKPLTDNTVYTKETGSVYPYQDIQNATYVVSSYSTSDGIGGTLNHSYTYAGAKNHVTRNEWLGFRHMEALNTSSGVKSITEYNQVADGTQNILNFSATVIAATNLTVNSIQNFWSASAFTTGQQKFAHLDGVVEQSLELDGNSLSRINTSYTRDAFGNATTIVVDFNDGTSKTTTNTVT